MGCWLGAGRCFARFQLPDRNEDLMRADARSPSRTGQGGRAATCVTLDQYRRCRVRGTPAVSRPRPSTCRFAGTPSNLPSPVHQRLAFFSKAAVKTIFTVSNRSIFPENIPALRGPQASPSLSASSNTALYAESPCRAANRP